jgi:hypothetical protein
MINSVWKKLNVYIKLNFTRLLIFVICSGVLYFLFKDVFLSLMLAMVLAVLFLQWDNRIFILLALFFLITCPILLAFKQDALAETMAVKAYIMLVIGVVLQIIEMIRSNLPLKLKVIVKKIVTKIGNWLIKIGSLSNEI